jgi:formylglycine-generating enzyme required for sulfatase activity
MHPLPPACRRAIAAVVTLALLSPATAALSSLAIDWPPASYNPDPLPDDLLVPMPCSGAMAFRVIAVGPEPRTLSEGTDFRDLAGPLPLGPNGQGAYLLGKYEVTRLQAAALRAYAQERDCPEPLDPQQVGQEQTRRRAAADQRRPEARIAWYEARGLADDYAAWLRLYGGTYPDCRGLGTGLGTGPCIPRLGGEAAVVRLPTEPEWEYAARGGQAVGAEAFRYPLPPLAEDFARYAWTAANAGADPWPIGTRLAGPLGLHDLFGNVSEIQHETEPSERGEVFIARGGGYQSQPEQADSRYRDRFRLYDEQGRGRLSETGLRLLIGAPVDVVAPAGEGAAPPAPDATLAYLQVQTSVPASVRLDGTEIGRAGPGQPLRLTDRLPGGHLLLVQADGYRIHSQTLALEAGAWTRVQITLELDGERQEAGLSRAQWSEIRDQLTSLGQDPGEPGLFERITGGVPEATRAALRAFQQHHGLPPDGYATDRTRAALAEAIAAQVAEAEAARIAAEERRRGEREEAARRAQEAAKRQAEAEAKRQAEEAARLAEVQAKRRAKEAAAKATPKAFSVFRDRLEDGSEGPQMVALPGGRFQMGSPPSEPGRVDDERQHEVRVAAFAIGRTEVTFDEYDAFAKATGRGRPGDRGWGRGRRPVINVSWHDATAYAEWLSEQTGKAYRLPTEAQWEYAARAGTQTPFWTGECIHTDQANYNGNYDYNSCGAKSGVYRGKTLPVASLEPNPWGLYHMLGNVGEWTCSGYAKDYKGSEGCIPPERKNNANPPRGVRGGSWNYLPRDVRAAIRGWLAPQDRLDYVGLRLARTLTP